MKDLSLNTTSAIRIGTAGWNIPKQAMSAFPFKRSSLESYASVFDAVEINSSFYRPHRVSTYQRWAAAVPYNFRFAVKIPKAITHVHKLVDVEPLVDGFLTQVAGLGTKLGPLLVQLPPSLSFRLESAERFLRHVRARVAGAIACEPRHVSWFAPEVEALLVQFCIGRVAADPAPVLQARRPGGWEGLKYRRFHGSPRIYYSAYSDEIIQSTIEDVAVSTGEGSECWCIFDNTAAGAATFNSLTAKRMIATGAVSVS